MKNKFNINWKILKNMYVSIYILLVLTSASCNTGNNMINKQINLNQRMVEHNGFDKSFNDSYDSNGKTYKIIKLNYVDNYIKISYPQITGLSDTNKQKKINDLIKTEALKVLNYYNNIGKEISLDIDYDIKWKGSNLLSIQYSGLGNIKGFAYPNNIFYTSNIDINNINKLGLTDVVNIDENFVEKFKKGRYVPWDTGLKSAIDLIKDDIDSYNLVREFKNADSMGEENTSFSFSYFTEDSLGISIGVAHAIGDHAEFEINYKDIKENIKFESEEWRDFLNLFSELSFYITPSVISISVPSGAITLNKYLSSTLYISSPFLTLKLL